MCLNYALKTFTKETKTHMYKDMFHHSLTTHINLFVFSLASIPKRYPWAKLDLAMPGQAWPGEGAPDPGLAGLGQACLSQPPG